MFLNKTFFKTGCVKKIIYTQQMKYSQFCHEHLEAKVVHPHPYRPCRIDYKTNIIKCRYYETHCRCHFCPYKTDRIIYYINPTAFQDKEITC